MHELPSRERTRIRAAFIKGKGRSKEIALAPVPTIDATDYHRVIDEARQRHLETDVVVTAQGYEPDLTARLRIIEQSLAREAAGLLFERQQAEQAGRDGSQFAGRRIDALTKIASVVMERCRLGLRGESSKHLKIVSDLFAATVRRIGTETLPNDVVERFMTAFHESTAPNCDIVTCDTTVTTDTWDEQDRK